jgi:hypothetical protein
MAMSSCALPQPTQGQPVGLIALQEETERVLEELSGWSPPEAGSSGSAGAQSSGRQSAAAGQGASPAPWLLLELWHLLPLHLQGDALELCKDMERVSSNPEFLHKKAGQLLKAVGSEVSSTHHLQKMMHSSADMLQLFLAVQGSHGKQMGQLAVAVQQAAWKEFGLRAGKLQGGWEPAELETVQALRALQHATSLMEGTGKFSLEKARLYGNDIAATLEAALDAACSDRLSIQDKRHLTDGLGCYSTRLLHLAKDRSYHDPRDITSVVEPSLDVAGETHSHT